MVVKPGMSMNRDGSAGGRRWVGWAQLGGHGRCRWKNSSDMAAARPGLAVVCAVTLTVGTSPLALLLGLLFIGGLPFWTVVWLPGWVVVS